MRHTSTSTEGKCMKRHQRRHQAAKHEQMRGYIEARRDREAR